MAGGLGRPGCMSGGPEAEGSKEGESWAKCLAEIILIVAVVVVETESPCIGQAFPETHHVAQAGLKVMIFLPQPARCLLCRKTLYIEEKKTWAKGLKPDCAKCVCASMEVSLAGME